MSSSNLFKIGLLLFILFAIGEVVFTLQRYGKDIFKPRPGSCKILEEKFCFQGKLIQYKNTKYVGFKLESGTLIFSPIDGQASKSKLPTGNVVQGFYIIFSDPDNRKLQTYNLTGDIKLSDVNTTNIKTGQVFASIGSAGAKNLGNYNLLVNISSFDPLQKKAVSSDETIISLFKINTK